MPIFTFDPEAADFDGNTDIQLSATGGLLTYLVNRDAISITAAGGIVPNGTWRDEIGRGDELRIDFTSASIETVDIEFKRLGSGEAVTAEVRDSGGALLGLVTIPGQGSSATSSFTATIDQAGLDTPGTIASIELSRVNISTQFVVGTITASAPGDPITFDPEAIDFDGNDDIQLSAIGGGELAYLANRDAVSITAAGGVIPNGTWRDEIGKNDELRIDFTSDSIDTVNIEFKRLGSGEAVTAEVRDSGGALLGLVSIPGQGSSATSSFTATITQADLETPGAIASIELSRANNSTQFVVGTISAIEGSSFPSSFSLADLDGSNGFRLDGIDAFDVSGFSVASAGDVNGDGFDDIIIGAPGANPDGTNGAGETYVVFGQAGGFSASLNLASLDGNNGFRLDGINMYDLSGTSVASAGDVNGDGFDDVVIGARRGNSTAGESYVVFGQAGGFAATQDLASLDGSNGFRLEGIDTQDYSGNSLASAGDVNGDGFDDIIIGAAAADPGGDNSAGESYVVFGRAGGFAAAIDLAGLDGGNGFRLDEIDTDDFSGQSVASAGDVNGDGFDDLIINGSYVIFGQAGGFAAAFDLASLDGGNGFRLDGGGYSVASAGDINGDGFDDVIIGDPDTGPGGGIYNAGTSYVVFGHAGAFAAALDLTSLDGSNGFRLNGVDNNNSSGASVASAGDVNGDGFDDVIIGARFADPGSTYEAGESYLVFGQAGGFAAALDLASLGESDGFRLDGIDASDGSGDPVASAGDVNGDGFDDLIIGAPGADPGGLNVAGESYVIFGRDFRGEVDFLGTTGNDTLTGTAAAEILVGELGNDTLLGGGGGDSLQGGFGDDVLGIGDAGFLKADGGGDNGLGTGDVLRLLGSDMDLDLTLIANNRIADIETINIEGAGTNIVTLNVADVLDSSTSTNTLTLLGDGSDAVVANFSGLGGSSVSAGGFTTYTIGAAEFVVDDDIDQSLIVL